MPTTNFSVRIDDNLRDEATKILAGYGLSPTQAIKLFLNQVVATRKVPLSFDFQAAQENRKISPKLARAIAELENDDLVVHHTLSANGERLLRESIADFENGNYTELSDLNQLKQLAMEQIHD